MQYERIQLITAAPKFDAIADIVANVRAVRSLAPIDAINDLRAFARRGDTAALAWDGDTLAGCVCLTACHHFIQGAEWMPIKVALIRRGLDLARIGCSHFVYLHPDYWGQGHTLALNAHARRSNRAFTHTLAHGFATSRLEDWAAQLPGAEDVGLPGPHGGRVFIREITPEITADSS
ncbi:hypothetical protein SAMN04490248_12051 [Salinihabitans flavidus]|uniref:N-acetyltransferase domain-containing protein n=1 Tax=Salinihabitans flavidus TaxID=569882 RepID=A0A1H8UJB8_9RHOB|nr:hypothetical protein [Salinihabitans flavidus]SEP03176.1 hypothetical protein SAMN04490248_12051 [Salinihabitans flavidus]